MADFRAVMAVGEAVMNLLRTSYRPEDFDNELEFRTFTARDFGSNVVTNGASLFVYRVLPNGVHRTPPGRIDSRGHRQQTQLPVEVHLLLSFWASEASLQHTIAGWTMRTLEDTPILTAGILNAAAPGSFRPDEVVELTLAELPNEDLLRIWEVLGLNVYQLSVPYVARTLRIESVQRDLGDDGGLVQEREPEFGIVQTPEAKRT